MIIGMHSRENELAVNPTKGKQLTNGRSSGTDDALRLLAAVQVTVEASV